MKKPIIEVVGSVNMDLVVKLDRFPKEGETLSGTSFFTAAGGKGANQAVAAARLGAAVSFVGCVGDDSFGKEMLSSMRNEHINVDQIKVTKGLNTGVAAIMVNHRAQNQIVVVPGANYSISKKQIEEIFSQKHEGTGALLLQLEIPIEIVVESAIQAKKKDFTVILNPAPARELPKELLENVDYLILNEHEAKLLSNKTDIQAAAQILWKMGVKHIIVTLGDKGALYVNGKENIFIPAFSIEAVDPTAAGDSFVGAFAVCIMKEMSIKESMRYANAVGALATTKMGAQPSLPTSSEVDRFLSLQ